MTTFKSSIVFRGSWDSIENWFEPKPEPPLGNLACPRQIRETPGIPNLFLMWPAKPKDLPTPVLVYKQFGQAELDLRLDVVFTTFPVASKTIHFKAS